MPLVNFYENQGVPEQLWDFQRICGHNKAFLGSTQLAPTVSTPATWIVDGTAAVGRAAIYALLFATDTAISVQVGQCGANTGIAAGTVFTGSAGLGGNAWVYRAAVAVPSNVTATGGKIFCAANSYTNLLAGLALFRNTGAGVFVETGLVAANCTLNALWVEFDD